MFSTGRTANEANDIEGLGLLLGGLGGLMRIRLNLNNRPFFDFLDREIANIFRRFKTEFFINCAFVVLQVDLKVIGLNFGSWIPIFTKVFSRRKCNQIK